MKKGVFYGVGIGPGDPELLTLKAVRVLKQCAVIAAPQTGGGEMLALEIAKGAVSLEGKEILPLRFTMSRDRDVLAAAHAAAADAVRACLDRGLDVAMLNLGDVSIYSTYSYLMERLSAAGYETVSVPGVPSFCAVAARLGVSLTEMHTPLHILPAGDRQSVREALALPGNKILMKSGKQLPGVLEALREANLLKNSAMVSRRGLPGETVWESLADFPPEESAGYFATIVVREGDAE